MKDIQLDNLKNRYTILGIDPGTNLGISILTIDASDNSIVDIETFTYRLNVYESVDRLIYLNQLILEICYKYQPTIVGCEAAFSNIKFPLAVMTLSQYIAIIDLSLRNYSPYLTVLRYPPKLVKKIFKSGGDANKEDMYNTLKSIPELWQYLNTKTDITEHEVDATAIAYITLDEIRRDPFLTISI